MLVLSLAVCKRLPEDSQAQIEDALESVRQDYSPSFFHTLRKFDYFQKGAHFRTHSDYFRGLDRCLLGKEEGQGPLGLRGAGPAVGRGVTARPRKWAT